MKTAIMLLLVTTAFVGAFYSAKDLISEENVEKPSPTLPGVSSDRNDIAPPPAVFTASETIIVAKWSKRRPIPTKVAGAETKCSIRELTQGSGQVRTCEVR